MIPLSLLKIGLSCILGGILGEERETTGKPAGLRTHMLVCMAFTLITILSLNLTSQVSASFPDTDPIRMIEGALAGMGFIGAGTILKTEEQIVGLTTATSLWLASMVGIAIGFSFYQESVVATILGFVILKSKAFYA